MQRAIRPDWLLRQADDLAGQGVGQPRNADLRRAVSASYYALYHHIVLSAVQHLMPTGNETHRLALCRDFEHSGVKTVCDWVTNPGNSPHAHLAQDVGQSVNIFDVAVSFPQLREARMEADYDHQANFTRPTVRARVEMARRAIGLLDDAKGSQPHEGFMAMLAMKANPKKR